MSRYYDLCTRNVGRPVVVRTVDGREYRGRIARVTQTHLFIGPFGRPVSTEQGGYHAVHALDAASGEPKQGQHVGWGWGWGWGPGPGFVTGVAFGVIATLAFLPCFWI